MGHRNTCPGDAMELQRRTFALSIACISMVLLEGCSIVYSVVEGISSGSDHDVTPGQIGSLPYRGVTDIQLITDSMTIRGAVVGMETMDSSTYCRKWDFWREAAGIDLRLGDSVDAIRHQLLLGDVSGCLRGITEGSLQLQSGGEARSIAVSAIRELRTERGTWSGKEFQKMIADHPPPALLCLAIRLQDGRALAIPVDEVRGGEYERSFNGWGLLVAVPIDLAVVAAILMSPPKFGMGP